MNLDEVRVKINDINDQMLALFKERMELSKDVAAAKKEMNKAIYDAKRERDILDKVTRDAGPDRKSTRLNSSHSDRSRMPSSA